MQLWDSDALQLPFPQQQQQQQQQGNSLAASAPCYRFPHCQPNASQAASGHSALAAVSALHRHNGDGAVPSATCWQHVDSLLASIQPHFVVMVVDATGEEEGTRGHLLNTTRHICQFHRERVSE